jgi:multiple sugar transport system substrate-binding protein
MRLKRWAMGLVVGVLAVAAGCSKGPEAGPAPGPGSVTGNQAPVRLLEIGKEPVLDAVIAAYYDKYPNDRIEKVTVDVPPGLDELKLKIDQAQVDLIPLYDAAGLIQANLLLPLDPYIQSSRFDLGPFGAGLDQLRWEGKLYDLPSRIDTRVLVYNADLFARAGVPAASAGWTWEQFRETARTLTAGTAEAPVLGFDPPLIEWAVRAQVEQLSGGLQKVEPKHVQTALQYFSTLVFTDQSVPKAAPREWERGGWQTPASQFASGKAAMSLESLSYLRFSSNELKFRWDVAPLPVAPGTAGVTPVQPFTYGIAATSKNPEAAWRFLRFLTGPEGSAILAKAGILPSYNTPVVRNAWFGRQPAPPPGTETLFETTWTYPSRNADGRSAGVYLLLNRAANEALSGQRTWEEASADFSRQWEQLRAGAR